MTPEVNIAFLPMGIGCHWNKCRTAVFTAPEGETFFIKPFPNIAHLWRAWLLWHIRATNIKALRASCVADYLDFLVNSNYAASQSFRASSCKWQHKHCTCEVRNPDVANDIGYIKCSIHDIQTFRIFPPVEMTTREVDVAFLPIEIGHH